MFQRSNNSDSSNSKCRRVPTPSNEKFRRYSRFLWIFPKVWQWKLPKFSFERYFYVVLLFALNGYLIYYSLTANYCLYVFAFLGANFGLNLAYYLLMKVLIQVTFIKSVHTVYDIKMLKFANVFLILLFFR